MIRALARLALVGIPVFAAGCRRPPDISPPQLRLGEQECDSCRMLVNDERFAAALVFQRDGNVTKLVFDDINCVFDYLAEQPPAEPYHVYTHDLDTRAWLDARRASFICSAKLETPMASQIAAAPTPEAAAALLEHYPGERLTFEQVAGRFTRSSVPESARGGEAP
ncbi:MAG: nitrous oxide reductase accessory protein NosL [Planctomycetota bacterium]